MDDTDARGLGFMCLFDVGNIHPYPLEAFSAQCLKDEVYSNQKVEQLKEIRSAKYIFCHLRIDTDFR